TSDYVAMLDEVRGNCIALREIVLLDEGRPSGAPDSDWTKLLDDGARVSRESLATRMAELKPDDPINIQYTSGTTGSPKGATLSHRNILNNAFFTARMMKYSERERMCIPVPFYHCAGMVCGNLACVTHGATMVIPAPSFEPGATLKAVEQERCTSLGGVPTMHI